MLVIDIYVYLLYVLYYTKRDDNLPVIDPVVIHDFFNIHLLSVFTKLAKSMVLAEL